MLHFNLIYGKGGRREAYMKIKQALKRITSAGLSVALALSSAITSYADGTSGLK